MAPKGMTKEHSALLHSTLARRINDEYHNGVQVYKANDRQVATAWDHCCGHDAQFATKFNRIFKTGNDKVVKDAIWANAQDLTKPKEASKGKGKGKGKTKNNDNNQPKGKGKGKGKASGNTTAFADLPLPDDITLFYDPDGKATQIIPGTNFDLSATGVVMMSANDAYRILESIGTNTLGDEPLAILMPPVHQEFFDRLDALPFTLKYRPQQIKELPTKKELKDSTRRTNATLLQLGIPEITYNDPTIVHALGAEHVVQMLSAHIYMKIASPRSSTRN